MNVGDNKLARVPKVFAIHLPLVLVNIVGKPGLHGFECAPEQQRRQSRVKLRHAAGPVKGFHRRQGYGGQVTSRGKRRKGLCPHAAGPVKGFTSRGKPPS